MGSLEGTTALVAEISREHRDRTAAVNITGTFLSMKAALKRLVEPEEVSEAVVWLCSLKGAYVTGHTLVADGGAVLG